MQKFYNYILQYMKANGQSASFPGPFMPDEKAHGAHYLWSFNI
jgi:hypothetical protein